MPGGGEGRVRVVIRNRASEPATPGALRAASFLSERCPAATAVIAALPLWRDPVEDALVPEHDAGSGQTSLNAGTAELVDARHFTLRFSGAGPTTPLLASFCGAYASDKPDGSPEHLTGITHFCRTLT